MLNEMKYVYAVYQEKSFSKAARKLQVSQPALSKMVRKAEKDIGIVIFDRSTIPITVTKEGDYYIKSIEDIMFIQRNIKSYFMDLKELNTGSLSLGGSSFFCSFVFPGLIGRFREKYPNVVIDLMEGNIGELREGLENETVDLVIETATDVGANIERYFYNNENIILAVPTRYQVNKRLQPYRLTYQDILTGRFAGNKTEAVPMYELREVPFITMKPGNDMFQRSNQICRNAGFTMKTVLLVDQVLTSVNIASNGVGAVFIRSDIVSCMPKNEMLTYYKIGDPLATRPVSFAAKKGKYTTSAMREFMHMAGVQRKEEE
ncbi:LysR family transcriptional regulator [Clostridium transplantifaecale]|uniref:LysR family transcriptional regulator n=1 Tax=Clostridium transplantifaecale TaxID=2479838 RepID=UPI000F638195|nr:LysR family transcriptional regulator [Clostridium transplantifaecale]